MGDKNSLSGRTLLKPHEFCRCCGAKTHLQNSDVLSELSSRRTFLGLRVLSLAPKSAIPESAVMHPRAPIVAEKNYEIVQFFYECRSISLTSQRFGFHHSTIENVLHRAGIDWKSVRVRRLKPNRSRENKDLILKMMQKGSMLKDIAKAVGTTGVRVKQFLKLEGVPFGFCRKFCRDRNPNWKGGRNVDDHGYILVHSPKHPFANHLGYVREHRLVMEKYLGRYLTRSEVVHHKNEVKDDNRIENLELFETNGHHISASLKGKIPKWTKMGYRRILAGLARGRENRRARIRAKREQDVQQSQ